MTSPQAFPEGVAVANVVYPLPPPGVALPGERSLSAGGGQQLNDLDRSDSID